MEKGFEKIYGISERRDEVVRRGTDWYLYFGQGKDTQGDYVFRKVYDHKPSPEKLKADITTLVNRNVDEKILTGYVWNGKPVYLSSENQFNYKSAYDLALQDETILPIKFKLGEDVEGKVVYYTFNTIEELKDFYTNAILHINHCLNEGWQEKDALNMSLYE